MRSRFKFNGAHLWSVAFAALLATVASGHARLDPSKKLKPRTTASNLKSAPCGNVPKTTNLAQRTVLAAGEEYTFEWEETIDHPGHYRLAFSPDGVNGFDDNVLLDNITDINGQVVYNDPSTYRKYSATVTLPSSLCDDCSIQLIQVMTDKAPPNDKYFSCADIRLVAPGDPALTQQVPDAPTGVKVEFGHVD